MPETDQTQQAGAPARRFIFIGGAEGSGTTVLLRLLSAPPGGVSLGGNFIKLPNHPQARQLMTAFDVANRQLCDRKLSFAAHDEARKSWRAANEAILTSEAFAREQRIFFKRSFPFAHPRDQYAPDLWDVYDLWPEVTVQLIYRDPRAASYSAFRRGFDSDIRRLAVTCSEQLTWLAGQVKAIGRDEIGIVDYTAFCLRPYETLVPAAEACGVPLEALRQAVEAEGHKANADDRWRRELPAEEVGWLDAFFDARRLRQWDVLFER